MNNAQIKLAEINKPMGLKNALALSKLIKLPEREQEKVTVLDWNMKNFEFLDEALPREKRLMYRATLNNRLYTVAAHSDESTVKVFRANSSAESKISKGAFSIAIIDEEIREGLYTRIMNVDNVGIPDFEREVEEQIIKEQQRAEQLRAEMSKQIDFNKATSSDKIENADISKDDKKFSDLVKKRKKVWRDKKIKEASDIRIFRDDYNTLMRTTKALKAKGVLVFVTLAALLDSEVSSKLANFYDDIRIYRNESLDSRGKVIVTAKKLAERKNRNTVMIEAIEEARYTPLKSFIEFPNEELSDEALNQLSIDNPSEYHRQIVNKMKKETYRYLDLDGGKNGEVYNVPKAKQEDVKVFRIGPVTKEELRAALNSSDALNKKIEKNISAVTQQAANVTPTPLHEGHIVMLLTSGILNGYIGKGINQHLVKGTARKEVKVEATINDDGTRTEVKKDFYNISVKTLNANGEFKEIM